MWWWVFLPSTLAMFLSQVSVLPIWKRVVFDPLADLDGLFFI